MPLRRRRRDRRERLPAPGSPSPSSAADLERLLQLFGALVAERRAAERLPRERLADAVLELRARGRQERKQNCATHVKSLSHEEELAGKIVTLSVSHLKNGKAGEIKH